MMTSRRYSITVPLSAPARARYQRWRPASVVALASGALLFVLASSLGRGPAAAPLLLISCMGLGGLLINEWLNSFGVRVAPDGAYLLTRVHPDFVRANTPSMPARHSGE